jgi:hypothetical protein
MSDKCIPDNVLVTRKDLAAYLRVSLATVDRGIRDKRWPFVIHIRIGKKIFFDLRVIKKAIDDELDAIKQSRTADMEAAALHNTFAARDSKRAAK